MRHCVYIGPIERLKGKTALVRSESDERVKAQFDDHMLLVDEEITHKDINNRLAFGWHEFLKVDFKPLEEGIL